MEKVIKNEDVEFNDAVKGVILEYSEIMLTSAVLNKGLLQNPDIPSVKLVLEVLNDSLKNELQPLEFQILYEDRLKKFDKPTDPLEKDSFYLYKTIYKFLSSHAEVIYFNSDPFNVLVNKKLMKSLADEPDELERHVLAIKQILRQRFKIDMAEAFLTFMLENINEQTKHKMGVKGSIDKKNNVLAQTLYAVSDDIQKVFLIDIRAELDNIVKSGNLPDSIPLNLSGCAKLDMEKFKKSFMDNLNTFILQNKRDVSSFKISDKLKNIMHDYQDNIIKEIKNYFTKLDNNSKENVDKKNANDQEKQLITQALTSSINSLEPVKFESRYVKVKNTNLLYAIYNIFSQKADVTSFERIPFSDILQEIPETVPKGTLEYAGYLRSILSQARDELQSGFLERFESQLKGKGNRLKKPKSFNIRNIKGKNA